MALLCLSNANVELVNSNHPGGEGNRGVNYFAQQWFDCLEKQIVIPCGEKLVKSSSMNQSIIFTPRPVYNKLNKAMFKIFFIP